MLSARVPADARFSALQGGCFTWTVVVLVCPPLRQDYSGNMAVFNVVNVLLAMHQHPISQYSSTFWSKLEESRKE